MKPRYSKFTKITNCNRISCFFSCWFVYLLVCLFVCLFVFFFIFIVRNTSHLEQLKLVQHKRQISIHACIKKNSFCKQLRENVIKDFAPLRFAPVATNIHAPPANLRYLQIYEHLFVITRDGQTSVTDPTDNLTTVSLRVVTNV